MRGVRGIRHLVALVLLSACASDKAPAEQAIKSAEAAVAGVKAEAASGYRTRCKRSTRRWRR